MTSGPKARSSSRARRTTRSTSAGSSPAAARASAISLRSVMPTPRAAAGTRTGWVRVCSRPSSPSRCTSRTSHSGRVAGASDRRWAPRLSVRASAAAPTRVATVCSAVASSAARSSGRRPASRGTAASTPASRVQARAVAQDPGEPGHGGGDLRPGRRASIAPVARGAADGLAARGQLGGQQVGAPPGRDEPLGDRVGGQPVRAVDAGARDLADRVEPGHARAPVEVGQHAAAGVVRGGRHRHGLPGQVEPGVAAGAEDAGEAPGEVVGAEARSRRATRAARRWPRGARRWWRTRRRAGRGRPAGARRP